MPVVTSKKGKIGIAVFVIAVAGSIWFSGLHEALTPERIKEEREVLHAFVEQNYVLSVLSFILLTVSTAFFVPGAIALVLAAGFFFGAIPGALFSVTGLTLGAVSAFLAARYVLGDWIQEKYRVPLAAFNQEMQNHGHYYLLTLRIVPVVPFFLVNILAGLTKISLKNFTASTSIGLLPASVVYSFAGRKLGSINSPRDVLSPGVVAALLLLAVLALFPVLLKNLRRIRNKDRPKRLD
ncbi:SNARE associated Golgi protein-like protein [Candidatus Sulfobium mesophilum]|uniref:TVP38/TMEM64 family membrane protein n=1 Tax=Candidatus Sulfobium mesophilum TaxID=2016548 RepID=A0A2U3QGT2_9BACT|nr:SNARE associated Golgi protein-like protein [Candidatus Sulfobium mesophilum]